MPRSDTWKCGSCGWINAAYINGSRGRCKNCNSLRGVRRNVSFIYSSPDRMYTPIFTRRDSCHWVQPRSEVESQCGLEPERIVDNEFEIEQDQEVDQP